MGFFKPAWQNDNVQKAMSAVEKETDQSKLIEIMQKAPHYEVRNAAEAKLLSMVEGMQDQDMLAKIVNAEDVYSLNIRKAAVAGISDQPILAHIAKEHTDRAIRSAATGMLTDESVLADICKTDSADSVRLEAVKQLRDEELLRYISKNDEAYYVRRSAQAKVMSPDDPFVLADIAKNDIDKRNRGNAVENAALTDQSVLTSIAKNDPDYSVRWTAVRKLTEQGALLDIALNEHEDIRIRGHAANSVRSKTDDPRVLGKLAPVTKEFHDYTNAQAEEQERAFKKYQEDSY